MFKLFVVLSFIYLSLLGYSLFFKYLILKKNNKTFYNLDIFYGLGFVILIAIIVNFYYPLIYLSFFLLFLE